MPNASTARFFQETPARRQQNSAPADSRIAGLFFGLVFTLASHAVSAPVDFVRDVRPIFEKHCYSCHGPQKQKSGLRLDIKAQAFAGGELFGASIVARDAAKSPLIRFVAGADAELKMPPDGPPLSRAEVDMLTRWVQEGAVWPEGVDRTTAVDRRDHWSFKPLAVVVPPATKDEAWSRGELDRFILARLEQAGLRPAPPADPLVWLRRVTLDLTGLPPTPEEVAHFARDTAAGFPVEREERFAAVVDRLLQSPRYGERWAQHWLDVVRYADTHGFEVNTERPNAWPYRDYVIQAFQRDTPYDRFVREQIVGDQLGEDAATGFLVTASVLLPGQIGADEPSKRLARQDALDEIVVNVGQTFLGLSVGCARCHDHKFDPLSQRDYYSLQAFVAGVEYQDRDLQTADAFARRAAAERAQSRLAEIDRSLTRLVPRAKSGAVRPMLNARENVDRFAPVRARRVRFTIRATNRLEPCVDELEVFDANDVNVARADRGARVTASGSNVAPDRHELRFVHDGQYGNSRSWMSNETGQGWVVVEFPREETIERVVWGRDREGKFNDRLATDYVLEAAAEGGEWIFLADASDRRPFDPNATSPPAFSTAGLSADESRQATALQDEKRPLETLLRDVPLPKVFAGTFRTPDEIRLLTRGDPEQPKNVMLPAVPAVLAAFVPAVERPMTITESQRRQALADWLTSPRNPLTARVMVNRLWQGHFGTGLVETPSDFGRTGSKPSHPELLDWLAAEFVRTGWSVKSLHRRIVLSATYRQSSRFAADAAEQDVDVRLLWRFPTRRLEAETIRDAMLAASGRLDGRMYGRGFDFFRQRGGLSGFPPVESFQGEGLRRMIYAHKVRRERDPVFGAFDCPDGGQSTARRRESTTPLQALNLFNSRFTLEQADALAARVRSEVGGDLDQQVRHAFRLVLSRDAEQAELTDAKDVVMNHGLALLARVLFNSNEFLFLP